MFRPRGLRDPRATPRSQNAARRAPLPQRQSQAATSVDSRTVQADVPLPSISYFAALYTKRSKKKHKTFQDGFVTLRDDRVITLMNDSGKVIAKSTSCKRIGGLREGNTLEVNSFEAEVLNSLSEEDFTSGRVFLPVLSTASRQSDLGGKNEGSSVQDAGTICHESSKYDATPSAATTRKFRPPLGSETRARQQKSKQIGVMAPLYSPDSPNAFVVQNSYRHSSGTWTVPIVMDPHLARHLRPHQQIGLRFLYKCVEGANKNRDDFRGAILADDMGLGKSLQLISLMWTMLKQGPLGKPIAKKVVIVCPASLVGNWESEIKKWLGFERLKPVSVLSGTKTFSTQESIAAFVHGVAHRAIIISYEMFRSYAADLYKSDCGLLICDEGHRLKSAQGNKTIDALLQMPCRRRVILTGTPVQNDLEEYYAMCNFVCPGIFNSLATFKSVFATPILASRDASAALETKTIGEARATELSKISSSFVLRRTSETLQNYLPPKTETVVFCRLNRAQECVYEKACGQGMTDLRLSSNIGAAFGTITKLRKICCHPRLLEDKGEECAETERFTNSSLCEPSDSGKLQVACSLCLTSLASGDRVVLVSNFVSCLNILQELLEQQEIAVMRLDGSTPANTRTELVTRFNCGRCEANVFLLSAKAGGVGLNLIGANRLILFDPDWNPATDLQTMARVWRDGQKKDVFVYRLLATGTIEEKIFQRQLFKSELQIAVESSTRFSKSSRQSFAPDASNFAKHSNFSAEELKDLFGYAGDVEYCETLHVLERSQEPLVATGSGVDTHSFAQGLIHDFKKHQVIREQHPENEKNKSMTRIPCGRDDVLSEAINTESCRGLVSYLYVRCTAESSASSRMQDNLDSLECYADDVAKSDLQKRSADGASTSLDCDSLEEREAARGCLPPISRKRRRLPQVSSDSEDDRGKENVHCIPHPTLTKLHNANYLSSSVENISNGDAKEATSALTWSHAVEELDLDS